MRQNLTVFTSDVRPCGKLDVSIKKLSGLFRESRESFANFIVAPCKCSGSMKLVHIQERDRLHESDRGFLSKGISK